MTRRRCIECGTRLPEASLAGGRPQLYCSARCRGRHRRLGRHQDQRAERLEAAAEERYALRADAFAVARAARDLAAALDAEAQLRPGDQPAGWLRPEPELGRPAAPYTRAVLPLLAAVHQAVHQAVAVDRAAGHTWDAIGGALGVSGDTAARRYQLAVPGRKSA
ncbi:hypothetical protein ACJ6WD_39895 [Streptomyces sp. VTCC 41912]|uniref:hypothetical protein n=1 Tax=Streptomyces sp. VTCC 41912 TaxID=3383243 RepID=UPI003896BE5C